MARCLPRVRRGLLPGVASGGQAPVPAVRWRGVELAERLRRFAFEQDRKQNAIITEAIEAYLAERGA